MSALRLSLMRPLSSTLMTLTLMTSPILTTSLTVFTKPCASSDTWHMPSVPGASSTKQPKSLIEMTLPS